ncbi:MAG TPA: glutathione S-transferase [Caulobacteraceae bacterium]
MATPVLYASPGAASLAVHWLFLELGRPLEVQMLELGAGGTRSPGFLAVNPAGHVPALVVDGVVHTEVAAILMDVAEREGERRLAPPPGDPRRSEYLRLMVWLANQVQPPFRAWYYPAEWAGPDNTALVRASAEARIDFAWDQLDARLADGRAHLLGEDLTAADFLATMLMRWSRNLPRPAATWPNLGRYLARMRAMPSLIEAHRREGLTDWIGG